MRRLAHAAAALGACGAIALVTSCSNPSSFDDGALDAGDEATDDGWASRFKEGSTDGPGGACSRCSADLHSIIDCDSGVATQCLPDQGCGPGGTCVSACDAANGNKSSVGCDYYAVSGVTGIWDTGQTCFAAFVANNWGSPVTVTVERAGTTLAGIAYSPTGNGQAITYTALSGNTIPAGGVGVLFLSGTSCPAGVNVGVNEAVGTPGTGVTDAFHITTDRPVVAYDIYPYGGGSSAVTGATMLLPTSAWDDNYVATAAWSESVGMGFGNPWVAFVGQEDNTSFTIAPTADIAAGSGVPSATKGMLQTYTLNKGQILRFDQPADLSGSVVQSTKPIGSWGGHGCSNLEAAACDGMHQQIPPVRALGNEYVAVSYGNRLSSFDEAPPWRFVGAADGTTLTYEPAVAGAPTTLKLGQVFEVDAAGPFIVKSQDDKHPFFFGGHMTGCFTLPGDYGSPIGCAGDPEFVNVIPPAQYLSDYVFFTDPTYPETHLVFVRQKGPDNAFHDVTLDCAGTLTGWAPVGSSGQYEYTRQALVTGSFAKVGSCDNGRHEAKSDVPFALTVWGWGTKASLPFFSEAVSYAYPAGASVQPINTVVIVPTPY